MNHNIINKQLEKPQLQHDIDTWLNRTYFEKCDPIITLYQVKPVSDLSLINASGNPVLQWSPSTDTGVLGYHIYESTTELGIYQCISSSIVATTSFTIPNNPIQYYMVKAIKIMESGCGKFLQVSI